jgi:hypothetical protein
MSSDPRPTEKERVHAELAQSPIGVIGDRYSRVLWERSAAAGKLSQPGESATVRFSARRTSEIPADLKYAWSGYLSLRLFFNVRRWVNDRRTRLSKARSPGWVPGSASGSGSPRSRPGPGGIAWLQALTIRHQPKAHRRPKDAVPDPGREATLRHLFCSIRWASWRSRCSRIGAGADLRSRRGCRRGEQARAPGSQDPRHRPDDVTFDGTWPLSSATSRRSRSPPLLPTSQRGDGQAPGPIQKVSGFRVDQVDGWAGS